MHVATVLAADAPDPASSDARLIIAALIGVAAIIVLITWVKLHPFVALTVGAIGLGLGAGLPALDTAESFSSGFGATMASVGLLIGLGAMFGKLLADSGGADQIVDTIIGRARPAALPWLMALVGAIIGLPMFFEIGVVLLIPVIILVARRSGLPLFRIAVPTLAGLSVMHGLVPPHPGPLVAVDALDANLGLTLALGILVAVPTVIISGPVFSRWAARWVDVPVPDLFTTDQDRPADGSAGRTAGRAGHDVEDAADASSGTDDYRGAAVATAERPIVETRQRPSFGVTLGCILLPVVLMLAKAIADVVAPDAETPLHDAIDFVGTPLIALTIALLVGIVALGRGGGMDRGAIASSLGDSLPPIAGILLIVGAGGGLKQVLIDTGLAQIIADAVEGSALPVLLLAWIVAVLIRVATGSATVATVTASGILAPVAADLPNTHVSLMVLAIGAGSLFLSHVNDAGFWMIKEYMGTTVGETLKTWTVMECLISVCGLIGVLLLSLVI
ncbi:GntP family permease [Cryptosporangium aurantiacum]|uniref:Gluconate:H+ symporter, GntP family n=1 Tax=Cryptosporangium aurantiacum TaxID=134849 RepID=A0A1M7KW34_9ACTN|nr:SLC13 family permease [Cryptosporangium aurantiacum]SHM69730.1 gluconate:H+ symporter, GntP family [Cryptosporangium aurantiacum]